MYWECNTNILGINDEIKFIFDILRKQVNTQLSININKTLLEYKDVTLLSFGEQIRHFRIIKGLTQKQLANKINVNRSYISEIELDIKFPSIQVLKKIIYVLDIEKKIAVPKYTLFLMNNPIEKLKKYESDNNLSSHKLSQILGTNSEYVKRWINGKTVISRRIYEKLNKIGIE